MICRLIASVIDDPIFDGYCISIGVDFLELPAARGAALAEFYLIKDARAAGAKLDEFYLQLFLASPDFPQPDRSPYSLKAIQAKAKARVEARGYKFPTS